MAVDNGIGPLLSVREVAALLHVHKNTVRCWSDRGIIRAYRIGDRGDRRFRREDIFIFLAQLRHNGGDERKASLDTYS
jgi:excisionase family DNA binding protein